jgi:chemotaxis protein CheD
MPAPDTRPAPGTPAAPAPVGVVKPVPGQGLNLLAGQLCFGKAAAQVRTLLGSCVCVTLWHPAHGIGGMCHFLLPSRARSAGMPMDARFGDEALALMVRALQSVGLKASEFEAHLYGGADTMPDRSGIKLNIGERNIEQGWSLIDQYGFQLVNVDVGDNVPRTVAMDLVTGDVQVRRGQGMAARPSVLRAA